MLHIANTEYATKREKEIKDVFYFACLNSIFKWGLFSKCHQLVPKSKRTHFKSVLDVRPRFNAWQRREKERMRAMKSKRDVPFAPNSIVYHALIFRRRCWNARNQIDTFTCQEHSFTKIDPELISYSVLLLACVPEISYMRWDE